LDTTPERVRLIKASSSPAPEALEELVRFRGFGVPSTPERVSSRRRSTDNCDRVSEGDELVDERDGADAGSVWLAETAGG
jgi:hypothetical protein